MKFSSASNPEKTRLRTEEELQNQAIGLAQLRNILDGLQIPYFIGGGTLLGIIRDNDFIAWDWDVELCFRFEDIYVHRKTLLENLKKHGFSLENYNRSKANFKITAGKFGTAYELLTYRKNGEFRQRMRSKMPDKFFSEGNYVTLRGEKYQSLNPPEEYLAYNYGDWKTPMRTADRSSYTTSHSRMKITLLDRLRNIFGI